MPTNENESPSTPTTWRPVTLKRVFVRLERPPMPGHPTSDAPPSDAVPE
jgi:hypothetical protein